VGFLGCVSCTTDAPPCGPAARAAQQTEPALGLIPHTHLTERCAALVAGSCYRNRPAAGAGHRRQLDSVDPYGTRGHELATPCCPAPCMGKHPTVCIMSWNIERHDDNGNESGKEGTMGAHCTVWRFTDFCIASWSMEDMVTLATRHAQQMGGKVEKGRVGARCRRAQPRAFCCGLTFMNAAAPPRLP